MSSLSCRYAGPITSYSGYGEANRTFVRALVQVGVEVTTQVLYYDNNKTNYFGDDYEKIKDLENRDINYDIKIIHIPCDSYLQHLEPCKYHIGHLFWETDKMSASWVWNCNLMDEIWTGSESNRQAFIRSGVKAPVYIFPETIDTSIFDRFDKPLKIPGHEGFLFLSMSQWIERKNFKGLITAYLEEFTAEEKVGLVIKTYRDKADEGEHFQIRDEIMEIKAKTRAHNAPPIYLYTKFLDKEKLARLYHTCDCYILPHYGEGWGRTIHEALACGKPVIATNSGGIHDWLTRECYYPLRSKETNVTNMEWAPWYEPDQKWSKVDVKEIREKMRHVFEHQQEAKEVGARGKGFASARFSFEAVGRMMKDRLNDIQRMIDSEREEGVRWPKV